jgi:dethiobiotin synthase
MFLAQGEGIGRAPLTAARPLGLSATPMARPPRNPTAIRGVFVTGTDTGVGKTVTAACLARAWQAGYWKPVQTGTATGDDDTATATALAAIPADRVAPPAYTFGAPLSPHAAAEREGGRIDLATIQLPVGLDPIVVEGAGGVLVPLNAREFMIDLMAQLALPIVLVARGTLGTINHTLLSLAALRARALSIAGVVMNGPPDIGNRTAIEQFGQVRVLAELPRVEPLDAAAVARLAARIRPLAEIDP